MPRLGLAELDRPARVAVLVLLPAAQVTAALRDMEDASFTRERLTEAARRLSERLGDLKVSEKKEAQRAGHRRVLAERDRLAAELERVSKPIADIARLVAQADACDRTIRGHNATPASDLGHIRPVLAWGASRLAETSGCGS